MRAYFQAATAGGNTSSNTIPNSSPNGTQEKLTTPLDVDEDGSVSTASEVSFTLIDGSKKRTKGSRKSKKSTKKRAIQLTSEPSDAVITTTDDISPPESAAKRRKSTTNKKSEEMINNLNKNFHTDVYKRLCFVQSETTPYHWTCRECSEVICQDHGTGMGNLRRHFATHEGCIGWIHDQIKKKNLLNLLLGPDKDHDIARWISFIVKKNLLFSLVEDDEYRNFSKLGNVSLKTLIKYMSLLREEVKKMIITKLRSTSFGLLFDDFDDGNGTHYCGIFAIVPVNESSGSELLLLGISTFEDEKDLRGDPYMNFVHRTLEQSDIDIHNANRKILFLVGNNTDINSSFASQMKVPFIGCYLHRLSLACEHLLEKEKSTVGKIEELMRRLSNNSKTREYLRKNHGIYDLYSADIKRNHGSRRWLLTFNMLTRFIELHPVLVGVNFSTIDKDVTPLLPTTIEMNKLKELHEKLKLPEEVALELLKEGDENDLPVARAFFDALLERLPELGETGHLNLTFSHCLDFENAISKVISSRVKQLTLNEKNCLKPFSLQSSTNNAPSSALNNTNNFAHQIRGQILKDRETPVDRYRWLHIIPPTSCVLEHLFRRAKLVLDVPQSERMLPQNIEMSLYLLLHQERWGDDLIAQLRRLNKSEEDNVDKVSLSELEKMRKEGEYDEYEQYDM